jgi:hypothetical protein
MEECELKQNRCPNRRPPFMAPYQPHRLANLVRRHGVTREYPWTLHFVWKLLRDDRGTLAPRE